MGAGVVAIFGGGIILCFGKDAERQIHILAAQMKHIIANQSR